MKTALALIKSSCKQHLRHDPRTPVMTRMLVVVLPGRQEVVKGEQVGAEELEEVFITLPHQTTRNMRGLG